MPKVKIRVKYYELPIKFISLKLREFNRKMYRQYEDMLSLFNPNLDLYTFEAPSRKVIFKEKTKELFGKALTALLCVPPMIVIAATVNLVSLSLHTVNFAFKNLQLAMGDTISVAKHLVNVLIIEPIRQINGALLPHTLDRIPIVSLVLNGIRTISSNISGMFVKLFTNSDTDQPRSCEQTGSGHRGQPPVSSSYYDVGTSNPRSNAEATSTFVSMRPTLDPNSAAAPVMFSEYPEPNLGSFKSKDTSTTLPGNSQVPYRIVNGIPDL